MKLNLNKRLKMKNSILSAVLRLESCDIQFLENKISEFELNIDDILNELELNYSDKANINGWIYYTFYLGASNFLNKVQEFAQKNRLKFIRSIIDIQIFTNYDKTYLNGKILNKDINIIDFSEDNLKSFIKKVMEA